MLFMDPHAQNFPSHTFKHPPTMSVAVLSTPLHTAPIDNASPSSSEGRASPGSHESPGYHSEADAGPDAAVDQQANRMANTNLCAPKNRKRSADDAELNKRVCGLCNKTEADRGARVPNEPIVKVDDCGHCYHPRCLLKKANKSPSVQCSPNCEIHIELKGFAPSVEDYKRYCDVGSQIVEDSITE